MDDDLISAPVVGRPVDLVGALGAAHAALDAVSVSGEDGLPAGWAAIDELEVEELGEVVRLAALLEGRTSGLKLHVVAAAERMDAAEVVAATDTGAWAARSAGGSRTREWGSAWLADLLGRRYHHVRRALARGEVSEEHAVMIVRAGQRVPETVTDAELAECEAVLVAKARHMTPRNLRRAARRLLDPLGKAAADELEEELLGEVERDAERDTVFQIVDNEDGTYGGRFTIPELHGQLLLQALERLTAPRRHGRNVVGEPVEDPTVGFRYRRGRIPVDQVLRLACEAGQMPLVMGGNGLALHLGSSTRLFTKAQGVALSAWHETCAAEGCLRPYSWCELHHLQPWSQGGPTDLGNATPLCEHHHRGEIRFRHRWPSRRRRDRNDRDTWAA